MSELVGMWVVPRSTFEWLKPIGAVAARRARRQQQRTYRRTAHCRAKHCRKFISRPSAVCSYCGNDPVPLNSSAYEYDRAHGWENLADDMRGL